MNLEDDFTSRDNVGHFFLRREATTEVPFFWGGIFGRGVNCISWTWTFNFFWLVGSVWILLSWSLIPKLISDDFDSCWPLTAV